MRTEPARARSPSSSLSSMRWRLLLTPPDRGTRNMALDDALLARARATGESVLRIYTWLRPTLSLGRNQTARGKYDLARAHAEGVDIVRRQTGGRAVLHHREITYSVTAPAPDDLSLRESYARINRLLRDGLRRLGVAVEIAIGAAPAPRPGLAPCFDTSTAGELVVASRKLVGSAQWRERGALLQHGSILVDDDQSRVTSLLLDSTEPHAAPATLREAIGAAPTDVEVADAMFAAVRALEDADASDLESDAALDALTRSAQSRFEDTRWTWRR